MRNSYVCPIWDFIFDTDQAKLTVHCGKWRTRVEGSGAYSNHTGRMFSQVRLNFRTFSHIHIGKLFLLHDSAVYVHSVVFFPTYVFIVENPRYRQNNIFANFFRDKFKLAFLPHYLFCLSWIDGRKLCVFCKIWKTTNKGNLLYILYLP